MSPSPSSRNAIDVYRQLQPLLGAVPEIVYGETCDECFGPVSGYARCWSCKQLFSAAPGDLSGMMVPMSTAKNPSTWYSKLVGYKHFEPENQLAVAALSHLFVTTHKGEIEGLLGGEIDAITIVPSTRGRTFENQPLRHTLERSPYFRDKLQPLVSYRTGTTVPRQTYTPEAFPCRREAEDARILLVEDTWVSGSKAVSAAGALIEAGARSVVIAAVARLVEKPGYFPADHPYYQRAAEAHDYSWWPR